VRTQFKYIKNKKEKGLKIMKTMYMVTSSGVKAGKAYATLNRVVQGTKDNGDKYSFVDTNSAIREAEELPLGSIHTYETNRTSK
jgi:hypothetical protein